jgi:hypothetical protein
MRSERARQGRGPAWTAAALVAALAALVGPACTPELCTRHSECPVGYQCSATAQCELRPEADAAGGGDGGVVVPGQPDGGVVIGDLPDGGGDDAGEPDAALADAAADPDASEDFDAAVADAAPDGDAADPPLVGHF